MTQQERMRLYQELDEQLTVARELALKIVAHVKAKRVPAAFR